MINSRRKWYALFTNIIQRTHSLYVFLSPLGFVSVTAFEGHLSELNTLLSYYSPCTYIRDIWSRKRLTMTVIIRILLSFFYRILTAFSLLWKFSRTQRILVSWRDLNRLPATTWLVVYASGSKCQNTRNVPHRRYLNGAKFWRNRYVGKSNSDRVRSYRRHSLSRVGDGPGLTFSLIEIEVCSWTETEGLDRVGWVRIVRGREKETRKVRRGIRSRILEPHVR